MKDSQQKLLEEIQTELRAQKKELRELRSPHKAETRWKSLLGTGIVLIITTSILAYMYHGYLESISIQIPR